MKFPGGLASATLLSVVSSAIVFASACSSSSSSVGAAPEGGLDASTPLDGGGPSADAAEDASAAPDAAASTCEGACKTTDLQASFGTKKRVLVRAQFGTQGGSASPELHTESHLGGEAACPQMSSPSPDYTLILTKVPRGAAGRQLSNADGIISTFLDFKGDLGLPPATKATTVNITVVAEDPATPPSWVAIDVSAVFAEGTVSGHIYAGYCESLSLVE
jgi:hypothetical protein